ncbi:MAG: aspartate/glutamate racemase family protein, partial [Clostridia bacterium]|nr:aspartate/glutamate racemase family protein [Clostridia bacterium]
TPDRTDFILGRSENDPVPVMVEEVCRLAAGGADLIAIPCNTAHFFYERVAESSPIPILNIIERTAAFCRFCGYARVGVLATEGTVRSNAYKEALARYGVEYETADSEEQRIISHVIYSQIKQGIPPDLPAFLRVAEDLRRKGCDAVILGWTELSLLNRSGMLGTGFVDSLEVLAATAIRLCGKEPCGFDEELMKFLP